MVFDCSRNVMLDIEPKMAYAPLPKLVPIGSPRVATPIELAKVLQSEPMKRLLSKPNIVIKAIYKQPIQNVQQEIPTNKGISLRKKKQFTTADISVSLIDLPNSTDDEHLLPSKNDGKSEILLQRIKRVRKKCGHIEPCEEIICDVNIQHYEDNNGSLPMVAINIDESEINASVSKHCEKLNCDALSIDHDKCRRAIIRLSRFDKSNHCDICGIAMKTRKSRLSHRNCRRKYKYRYDNYNKAEILKERMREREIQLMEDLKMKRKNPLEDPLSQENVMETLKKNSELIITPKTRIPKPIITIKAIPNPSKKPVINNNLHINTIGNMEKNNITTTSLPPLLPSLNYQNHNNIITHKITNVNLNTNSGGGIINNDNQFITTTTTTTVPQTITYPLNINEWMMTGTGNNSVTTKPILMPIRIVPIANLRSEPSAMHQKQGIPRFCIVADSSVPPQTYMNFQTAPTISTIGNNNSVTMPISSLTNSMPKLRIPQIISTKTKTTTTKLPVIAAKTVQKIRPAPSKIDKNGKIINLNNSLSGRRGAVYLKRNRSDKKPFQCEYCHKRFLTDWYFKAHIARHKGDIKAKCEVCKKAFTNNYDMKRHMKAEHTDHVPSNKCEGEEEEEEEGKEEGEEEEEEEEEPIVNDELNFFCESCETYFDSNEEHDCKGFDAHISEDDRKYEKNCDDERERKVPKFKIINVNGVRRTSMRHSSDEEDGKLIIDDDRLDSEIDDPSDSDIVMDDTMPW